MDNILKSPVVALLLFNIILVNCEFPNDPKPCNYGDSDCLVKIISYFAHEKPTGDDSIDLISIDPLIVDEMRLKQSPESPVNIDLMFTNNQLEGLRDIVVTKVKGFGKNIETKHEIHSTVPRMQLTGDYKIDGRVLILPISGIGKSNFTLINSKLVVQLRGKAVERNGETYLEVADTRISLKPERMIYNLGNLFNGDKELGDTMNQFLNDNWKEVFDEVHDSLTLAFSQIFHKALEKVFAKYPYEKYFLPDSQPV